MAIFSLTDTGTGLIGNPMEFLCPGPETVMLEGLCDGSNDCPNGEDETNLLCESKLYPDSPSETWVFQGILLAEDNAYCTPCMPTLDLYMYVHAHYNSNALYLADKCRLPYYGNCDFTRECVTSPFSQVCGNCLFEYTEDQFAADPANDPCIRK